MFSFVVVIGDLVHVLEAIHGPMLTANSIWKSFFFLNMSDARETANCSFADITHFSGKISRCY